MNEPNTGSGYSRRDFLKGIGLTAVTATAERVQAAADELKAVNAEKVVGPDAVPISLRINGSTKEFTLEPRVTLLDALRNHSNHTGAKEVCDRGTCGACTVLMDGEPVYSCMTLAIEAQGREITTVEGLAKDGKLTNVQQAFIDADGLQCGYCTPGFVMSVTALLQHDSQPSEEEVRKACSGHLCRCGSYPRIFEAALAAAGARKPTAHSEVLTIPPDQVSPTRPA